MHGEAYVLHIQVYTQRNDYGTRLGMSNTAVAAPIKLVSIVRKAASKANMKSFVIPRRFRTAGESCLDGKAGVQSSGLTGNLISLDSRCVNR